MPARIEQPRSFYAHPRSPRLELFKFAHGFGHVLFHAEDSYKILHDFLQIAMNSVRIFFLATVEGRKHVALSFSDLLIVDRGSRSFAGVCGSAQAGTPAKHQEVRKRVAAKPIG